MAKIEKYTDLSNTTEKYIEKIYNGTSAYGNVPYDLSGKPNVFTTYGEMLPSSVTKIINFLKINNNDVFYDLGSGSGKFVTQIYLQTPAAKSTGIEIVKFRHNIASKISNKIKFTFNKPQELVFINGDILTQNLNDATIIYMCSTCFSEDFLTNIVNKLSSNTNLRAIVTLKKIDNTKIPYLHKYTALPTPCTWSSSVTSHIYYK